MRKDSQYKSVDPKEEHTVANNPDASKSGSTQILTTKSKRNPYEICGWFHTSRENHQGIN